MPGIKDNINIQSDSSNVYFLFCIVDLSFGRGGGGSFSTIGVHALCLPPV